MKIIYIGDFIKNNGPSTVDILLKKHFERNQVQDLSFIFLQAGKKIEVVNIWQIISSNVVHVSGVSNFGLVALFLGWLFRKKCTMTMHGSLFQESRFRPVPKYRLIMETLQKFFATKLFPVSKLLAINIKARKAVVIPNGVERHAVNQSNKSDYEIVLVGGGRPEKRHLEVCKAIESVKAETGWNILVHLFGEKGKDSDAIESFPFIHYHGFCNKDELKRYLETAKLFIQYSKFESFSLAVSEALYCGCHIITSPYVGINEFIEKSHSYHVVDSRLDLENSIRKILSTNEKPAINERLLTWSAVSDLYLEQWVELYNE
ncbi:glycosyltransferase family 4 protein [Vibrio scophthalmi]|uniref:glycosyltransferase family 4 protein n=1 Tax=Vibrio scophthalmi TaxID=45658 RepID=UPI003EBC371E